MSDTKTKPLGKKTVRQLEPQYGAYERAFLPAIAKGLSTTVKHFFGNVMGRKYVKTIEYPDKPIDYPPRFRGMHRLVQREDGTPRCVACFMCQTACPARCIHIEGAELEDASIEKFPQVFEIDELRCVVCGLCVEACPCDAIRMDTGFHPKPVLSRDEAVFEKFDLLAHLGVKQTQQPPPPTAAGTGRVDRTDGDHGAGGSKGGYEGH